VRRRLGRVVRAGICSPCSVDAWAVIDFVYAGCFEADARSALRSLHPFSTFAERSNDRYSFAVQLSSGIGPQNHTDRGPSPCKPGAIESLVEFG
jgi:hypothetical protein